MAINSVTDLRNTDPGQTAFTVRQNPVGGATPCHAVSVTQGSRSGDGAGINIVSDNSEAPAIRVKAAGPLMRLYDSGNNLKFEIDNTGAITTSGTHTFSSLSTTGTLTVGGASTLTGNVSIGGTLAVTGTTTLTGAVTLTGGVTGSATLNGGDLTIQGTNKAYRLRRGGGGLDFEATGADLVISNWSGAAFNGTQRSYFRLSSDAQNVQVAGKVEFVDALYGTVIHTVDAAAGTSSFRALNVDRFSATAGFPLGITGAIGSLNVPSSYSGGDDDGVGTDSTGRINLYSFQRANVKSYGENIRNFAMRSDAKTMQAFYIPVKTSDSTGGYDPATRDPKSSGVSWKPVVWQGAHYEANDHGSIHGHWELEIADASGALQGRLEIPFIDQTKGGGYGATSGQLDGARIGIDYTNIRTNLADFSIRSQNISTGDYAGQNTALRVGGNNSVNKDLLLSISSDMQTTGRRWIVRANTDTESGGNAGTNFQLIRCDDNGATLGTPLFIQRSDGQITNGAAASKGSRFATVWGTSGIHGFSAQPTATIGSASAFDAQMSATTERSFQATVSGDANRRFVVYADGKHEFGDGTASRDANFYRAAASRLKTDTALVVGTQLGVGTNPNGTDSVTISLATDNAGINLTNTTGAGNTAAPLYRGETATSGSLLLTSRVTGDTVTRLAVTAAGAFSWGPGGSTARDTDLSRTAAGVLGTTSSFQVGVNLRINTTSVGGGTGVLGIANASVVPSINPTGGGVIYVEAGALKYRGSSGTVTVIAAA